MNTYFETTWTLSIAGTWATVEMLPGNGGLLYAVAMMAAAHNLLKCWRHLTWQPAC